MRDEGDPIRMRGRPRKPGDDKLVPWPDGGNIIVQRVFSTFLLVDNDVLPVCFVQDGKGYERQLFNQFDGIRSSSDFPI